MKRLTILIDQIFFQSSTSRPFYASRQRDWSAHGIPALCDVKIYVKITTYRTCMQCTPGILVDIKLKWRFHEPTNPTDERHKTADYLDFEKIIGRCDRFVKSADKYY